MPPSPPPSEQQSLLLTFALIIVILVGWEVWMAEDAPPPQDAVEAPPAAAPASADFYEDESIARTIPIRTEDLEGALSLKGARLSELNLIKYRESLAEDSPFVQLFSPPQKGQGYFAQITWRPISPAGRDIALPSSESLWQAPPGAELTPQTPLTLTYDNGEGLLFRIRIAVDEHYMLSIRQSVQKITAGITPREEDAPILVSDIVPELRLLRIGVVETIDFFILHEGFIGVFSEEGLEEDSYDDLAPNSPRLIRSRGGWVGITDKYWAAAFIAPADRDMEARLANLGTEADPIYEAALRPVAPLAVSEMRLFAGAKEVALIDRYAEDGIAQFDLLIDWGWLYFLTKPIFLALDFFFSLTANFGVAILLLTVAMRLLFFPLSNATYKMMSKMRQLQPQIEQIQKDHPEDWTKRNEAMMALYQKNKLQPAAGCLPVLLQAPVFFALYKVLFVTIEMRHVPFYGWIQDLSAPDPTSLLNLFGLLPFETPPFLTIGIWPLLMGFTLFIQMRMNPPATNPMQKVMMDWLPVFLTVIMATFPAGLVIYWVWSNVLAIVQQAFMMRRYGVPIMLFDNLIPWRGSQSDKK